MTGKVNLDRWMPHLRAAEREGKSIAAYARKQGVSRHTLYAARELLGPRAGKGARGNQSKRQGRVRGGAGASAFAAVKVAPVVSLPTVLPMSAAVPRLRAQLPDGVSIELVCSGTDTGLMSKLLEDLARLGCFGSMRS